jgi:hypothetical protein
MSTPEKTITVIIEGPVGDHVPALNVNGQTFPLAFGTPIELPKHAYLALMESTYAPVTSLVSPPEPAIGDGDGAAADTGGESGGTENPQPFDADAVITGTVAQVAERLGNLTPDELSAVEAAENDREQARKGVLDAIAAARAANPPSPPTDN